MSQHPAFRAWRELQPATETPRGIEILKGKPPREGKELRRIVCRITGVGLTGSAVIGKGCRPNNGMVEDTIYRNILPHLPFHSLNYYGMVEEPNGDYCWLFLQDAGEEIYSPELEDHQLLRAQWLALMHTSAARFAAPNSLPDKGLGHYLKRLRTIRNAILHYLAGQAIQDSDLVLFEATMSQCNQLESRWDLVEELCEGLPRTLVHGDFVAKNLRVRSSHNGTLLLPFDWGEAGWGTAARDIIHVDSEAYWTEVSTHWPEITAQTIQRSATAGRILRCIDAIYWLHNGWMETLKGHLTVYSSWLADAMQEAGLGY